MLDSNQLATNIAIIKENIDHSLRSAGRNDNVKIIGITKTRTPDEINQLLQYDIFSIGENRVQELVEKFDNISNRFDIQVVGQLQTNKVKYILDKVSCVQSVDRLSLAKELNKNYERMNSTLDVLVQLNLTDDPARGGVRVNEVFRFCDELQRYTSLSIKGLMAIAPIGLCEKELRSSFASVYKIYSTLKDDIKDFDRLSMGMSNDYIPAILEGATEIRLGSAIFGARI